MIKIKHKVQESNIPIPEQISDELMNRIKVHILNYLLDSIEKSIQITQRNFDKSKEELIAKPELAKDFYDDDYMRKQENMIAEEKRIYTAMHKHIPSDKYVVFSSTLRSYETMLPYANYIPSSFKYEILPSMENDDLTLQIYFDNKQDNKKNTYGTYYSLSKTIVLHPKIWEEFLWTMSTPKERWQQYGIYWTNSIGHSTAKFDIDSKLNNLWNSYKSTLDHELTHFVQYNFISKALWHKGALRKSIESEEDYRKYISSNIEFYPHLTGEAVDFFHMYKKFNNENFSSYIHYSDFFHGLEKSNIDKWKKAITQFYMLLQNKVTESIINNVSHRLLEDNMAGKEHNLKQWNMTQFELLKQLSAQNKININDMDKIYSFGQEFERWVLTHNMQSPTVHDIIQTMRL